MNNATRNQVDNNGNYYPHALTRNTTNSPTHIQQIFEDPRSRQLQRLPSSAFFNKHVQDISVYNPWKDILEKSIVPLLKYRASLATDSSATLQNHELVFIYDIDDITLLSIDHCQAMELMLPHIRTRQLHLTAEYLIFLLNFDELFVERQFIEIADNIEDVFNGQTDDFKKSLPQYTDLKNVYSKVSKTFDRKKSIINLLDICEVDLINMRTVICEVAEQLQKIYNQRWKTADKCLKLVKRKSGKSTKKYANVILSNSGVAYGASQLLVSGHASTIPIENIYSLKNVSKKEVFERIQSRFGEKCTLIYVTSFPQRASIPEKLNIPVWPLLANDSFKLLYKAQRDLLLR